jgi:6-pyruvoyltetrahydropterin/6-carboxytetrahydropterin synthase
MSGALVELRRSYSFEAAHWLPRVPREHKCARLHGHSYRVDVVVTGAVGEASGWLMDFAAIDSVAEPLCEMLDHRCLNDLPGLENPTCENLAVHLWGLLERDLPGLTAVVVAETAGGSCTYRGQRS